MLPVKGILSTVAQLARLGRRDEPAQPARRNSPPAQSGPSSAGVPPSDAMRQILAEFDVTNLSPREFSEMLQKLRQSGALSETDFQELSSIRLNLDSEGVDTDRRVNLVELCARRLNGARGQPGKDQAAAAARQATEASLQRQLDWMQNFARLHAGNSPVGFDATA